MSLNLAIEHIGEEKFLFLMKNGKRSSILNNFDFESLTLFSLKFVKETIPSLLKKGNFDKIIVEAFKDRGIGFFDVDVNYLKPYDCFYFFFWLKDEIEHWAEMEKQYLSGEPDFEMLSAGISDLDKFGYQNVIDSICDKKRMKDDEVWAKSYGWVFDVQWKSVEENRIQKKLLKARQSKTK